MNVGIFRGRAPGEVAVVGLGKSGRSAAELLARDGHRVYASDVGSGTAARAVADALADVGVAVELGGHDLARIARAAFVVASPGVPPDAPPITAARAAGVPVVGEIEVALHYLPALRYIAVTGTNGKTTTTALVGHLLRALGHDAVDAGNIGTPLAELALRGAPPPWAALELSSFQLHDTPSVRPTVGVVTNLAPDHLDRYASVDEYYRDKAGIYANADAGSIWVKNGDDAAVMTLHARLWGPAHGLPGDTLTFSLKHASASAFYKRDVDTLYLWDAPLLPRAELALLGDHNVANALAAALAVSAADAAHQTPDARERIAAALRSFRALPNRMETVGTFAGVTWINDSKATNVSSTRVALDGMRQPYVLLLGGRHKGEPYTALAEPFARFGRTVLAYGEAAPVIAQDLGARVPVELLADADFDGVCARARSIARPGDAVLLSPACSSFDMFANYEARGAAFRARAAQVD